MNLLKSELQYSTPFTNAKATNEGESDDFAHFNPKHFAMATSHERSEKEGQISYFRLNTYHVSSRLEEKIQILRE